ncbi:MAG: repeat-containing protein [Verrucomicrobiales bacterium]|nr:repeat-containing protein [Verrucomicrobiales bacterium]
MTKKITQLLVLVTFIITGFRGFGAPNTLVVTRGILGSVTISGTPSQAADLQASSDLQNWSTVVPNLPAGTAFTYPDLLPGSKRIFRLKSVASGTVLTDLSTLNNRVFTSGEGFNSLQYGPNGKLGVIVWRDHDLLFRERATDGSWSEKVISSDGRTFTHSGSQNGEEYRFQPPAFLGYDSSSMPHILRVSGSTLIQSVLTSIGQWVNDAPVSLPNGLSSFALFTGAMGPGGKWHVSFSSTGSDQTLQYGSNRNGSWQWSVVTTLQGNIRYFLPQSWAPRFFSMAIDSQNFAHIAYTPHMDLGPGPQGYARPYSELHYASNRSGQWVTETVYAPNNSSADAGYGASIALDANDKPSIANWYNERADTGSAQWSQMFYHQKDSNGNWVNSVAARLPDNYAAGDGDRGAGFAPYLRFDSRNRPNIIFSDAASEHFYNGQQEFAGQIRHTVLDNGNWISRTVYRQGNPQLSQIVYPAFAMSSSEVTYVALDRATQFDSTWRVANSDYKFVTMTQPGL